MSVQKLSLLSEDLTGLLFIWVALVGIERDENYYLIIFIFSILCMINRNYIRHGLTENCFIRHRNDHVSF